MNFNQNLGKTVSALFLLGLTIIASTIFYVADKAENVWGDLNAKALSMLEEGD